MNQETGTSRKDPRSRAELIEAIGRETRLGQNATHAIDELFSEYVGINGTDVRCMDLLHLHGPMTAGELAERTGLTTGAITAVLDRMERAGYLRRVRDVADRRKVNVELTERAAQVSTDFYEPLARRGAGILSACSTDDLRFLLAVTRRGRELSEAYARELRERMPRRSLVEKVRSMKADAKALKNEWAEEGRALKRELKAQAKAIKHDATEPFRRRPRG
jgi:DNA-binding MarR family transcriptional regulator